MVRAPAKRPGRAVLPRPDQVARTAEGGLIGVEEDGAVGWAWNPSRPDEPLHLALKVADVVVGHALANVFGDPRIEVLAGPGIPGFVARLDADPGCSLPFQLCLHDEADGAALGAPLVVRTQDELADLLGTGRRGAFQGHLDGLESGVMQGWARDAARPETPVWVEVLDGGVAIAAGRADRLREDLRAAGLGKGLYGFVVPLPAALLDGRSHSLTVRVAGSDAVLPGAPVEFGPGTASALMAQVAGLQQEVARLRAQMDGIIAADGQMQRRIVHLLGERVAAIAEIYREQTVRDIAALREMVFSAAERASLAAGPEQYGAARGRG
jgi:hypothetical protein